MTRPQPPTKPKQPIDGAPPKVRRVGRMTAPTNRRGPRKMKTMRRDSPVDTQPDIPVDTRSESPIDTLKTPEERFRERYRRERDEERDEAIKKASLRDKAILKAWDERVNRTSSKIPAKKRARDDDEVEIVEPAPKRAGTRKERVADEDDEVVIVEPPARDDKEEQERRQRNRQERRLRLLKAGLLK
ncbi:uncharacterized protein HD556DRAFT_1305450 [Suillus plorans]|nr:uncharacterized protein HD556DRAFT_1311805 [Suillus plorans]XP_041157106.1 uncharacterized protein HD556DRAFT_1310905 [Suillus plorans]XP_041158034.1 uncharacterized protein HD556DRAFT_1445405 [Suillus plorans]XP_041163596.1 uncharacterized protein HD556DRAFT_1305450 [Suillus plorans]KAG1788893.1 hypothetical protein HD556DRAFT_1311805 [Suillus plorans]KAG1790121.1 hypothetical protein HD556DRAFT_1310905 [Suillus plorans]KAG1791149.1 hypothetical protein HD556DRAFT_1445405 [Suillus plorans